MREKEKGMHESYAIKTDSAEAKTGLKMLAETHDVCYEIWPYTVLSLGRQVKVGFELQLCGANEDGGFLLSPGSPQCWVTYEGLRRIADAVIPSENNGVRCEVHPYNAALHGARVRRFRPEVVLTITILHNHGFWQPIDPSEEECLKQMCRRLNEIGIRRGN